ncbi:hypothetical protein DV738_g2168, partial [Chaetothyriales sp. CBS 135597]
MAPSLVINHTASYSYSTHVNVLQQAGQRPIGHVFNTPVEERGSREPISRTARVAPKSSRTLTKVSLRVKAVEKPAVNPAVKRKVKPMVKPIRIKFRRLYPSSIPRYAARGQHFAGLLQAIHVWVKPLWKWWSSRIPTLAGPIGNPFYRFVGLYRTPARLGPLFETTVASEFADVNGPEGHVASSAHLAPVRSCLKQAHVPDGPGTKKTVGFALQILGTRIPVRTSLALRGNAFYRAVDPGMVPSLLRREHGSLRTGSLLKHTYARAYASKVRTIAKLPTFHREAMTPWYQCAHALFWREYLTRFYPGLCLPRSRSRLLCIQGSCHSRYERRRGGMLFEPDDLKPSFWRWMGDQYTANGGQYFYTEGMQDAQGRPWYRWSDVLQDYCHNLWHPGEYDCWRRRAARRWALLGDDSTLSLSSSSDEDSDIF